MVDVIWRPISAIDQPWTIESEAWKRHLPNQSFWHNESKARKVWANENGRKLSILSCERPVHKDVTNVMFPGADQSRWRSLAKANQHWMLLLSIIWGSSFPFLAVWLPDILFAGDFGRTASLPLGARNSGTEAVEHDPKFGPPMTQCDITRSSKHFVLFPVRLSSKQNSLEWQGLLIDWVTWQSCNQGWKNERSLDGGSDVYMLLQVNFPYRFCGEANSYARLIGTCFDIDLISTILITC